MAARCAGSIPGDALAAALAVAGRVAHGEV